MSGHSKWSTIKRAKAVTDAKRGAVFTKLGNLITVAAREKGGDVSANFNLRLAIEKAKAANMPKENIERAIKRGTGELGGEQVLELIYEGIGPAKSQFIIKSLTDNKNRSAANIRHIFTKYGGVLGSVMWNFSQQGVVRISDLPASPELQPASGRQDRRGERFLIDDLTLELIDAGAEDIIKEEEGLTIVSKVEDLQKLKIFLEGKNINTETADIEYLAKDKIEVKGEDKEKIEKFIAELEDNEDVADYYNNVNI
ncbi:MAG: YebC/PmpR family DNA-binding transcriptional regulator [Patescibacteria group bacterium]